MRPLLNMKTNAVLMQLAVFGVLYKPCNVLSCSESKNTKVGTQDNNQLTSADCYSCFGIPKAKYFL